MMIAQRFVDTNPQIVCPIGSTWAPQSARAIPLRSYDDQVSVTSIFDGSTISVSVANSTRNRKLKRVLYHPGYGVIEYPRNPDRTVNYYRSAIRKHDISQTKTLQSNITIRDRQAWEDVVISEVWSGGADRLSMLAEFLDTLHLIRITEPDLGRHVGWIPKDLSYQRHMIEPIGLQVGASDVDILEARERINTSMDSYADQQVTFSFKLVRPQPLIDSLLVMEGR